MPYICTYIHTYRHTYIRDTCAAESLSIAAFGGETDTEIHTTDPEGQFEAVSEEMHVQIHAENRVEILHEHFHSFVLQFDTFRVQIHAGFKHLNCVQQVCTYK